MGPVVFIVASLGLLAAGPAGVVHKGLNVRVVAVDRAAEWTDDQKTFTIKPQAAQEVAVVQVEFRTTAEAKRFANANGFVELKGLGLESSDGTKHDAVMTSLSLQAGDASPGTVFKQKIPVVVPKGAVLEALVLGDTLVGVSENKPATKGRR